MMERGTSFQDVKVGDTVLFDIYYGVDPTTFPMKVISMTKKRFVAEGMFGIPARHYGRLTFRKEDGKTVGSSHVRWARKL